MLVTTTLGSSEDDTILSGVAFLYTSGSWPLALIVLVASVMIPLGKLAALAYLLITVQRGSVKNNHDRTRLYRMVEFIGRWSMLDVFVDTFTVALVQLQPLMSVAPGTGVLFFAAVVVLTMLAAETFDPRLIWDSAEPASGRPWLTNPTIDTLPQATVVRKRRMRFSVVWIIPILAGAGRRRDRGPARRSARDPTITIEFKSASGIEAGKTFIKYKDVRIGLVSAVELSEDYSKVLVKAKIAKHAAGLMVEDAKFWVVEPRISLSGVSGLNTLLSGNYIGFQAGKSTEDDAHVPSGLDEPPTITDQPGRRFILKARELGSLGVGDPVYYRGLQVGQVAATNLVADGKSVEITVFIDAPYDKYVTAETRFWNASGIDVSVGADGVNVRTESLASLLAGGVAFDSPDFATLTGPAAENHPFPIYRNRLTAMKQPDPIERRFVLYFNESVRGLSVGAPVTMYGLRVGEVTAVGLHYRAGNARPSVRGC